MILPQLASRMEQFGQLSRFRIKTSYIASFMQIAVDAGQSKVAEVVTSAMFPRKDMLDMQGSQGRLILVQTTILATEICPLANLVSRGGIHAGSTVIEELLGFSLKNGNELVRLNVSFVFSPFGIRQLAFRTL